MNLNCPLTLIQTENGFILRTLTDSTTINPDTRQSVVFSTIAEVKDYLDGHFKTTTCPKCSRPCERRQETDWQTRTPFVMCGGCRTIKIESDNAEWLELPPINQPRKTDGSDPYQMAWDAEVEKYRSNCR